MKHFISNFWRICSWIILLALIPIAGCNTIKNTGDSTDDLFNLFQDPPPEARPFVRWWWNGDCIEVDELKRELDVMKAAGIGGVEINPIAHPGGGEEFDYECYEWLGPEWNERVKATIEMAKQRDMYVDIIMGSGWPFGGDFLDMDECLQGVGIRKMEITGPSELSLNLEEVWYVQPLRHGATELNHKRVPELFFLRMVPHGALGEAEILDLMEEVDEQNRIDLQVPEGKHDLYIGTFVRPYITVVMGAPGSKGPVVNYYNAENVRKYFDRLSDTLEAYLGGRLGDYIRAPFVDSHELTGSNITDGFFEEFKERRGYDLTPFLPLVYYRAWTGYVDTLHYDERFNENILRIRYDFNRTIVDLFLERFTKTFDDWANEHGMRSRVQAYGGPWIRGILDGYRMVDIPESNNWLYSSVEDFNVGFYPDAKTHGWWIWNKYCASGAHLSGADIVSCEAMTNTTGVFRTTLNLIKKHDDFNFITGINHSILHGYNYSPPEAGFPGWVRFGSYFSDQNTWWPYFRHWSDYNARLSAVFQHSEPVVDVAIMTPLADIWKQWGLFRNYYHLEPWYNHELWEGFSHHGVTADYINEGVIQRATEENGMMKSEQASYQLVIVSCAESLEPETALAIRELAEKGLKFLFIDRMPGKTASYFEHEKNDRLVTEQMEAISSLKNVKLVDAPVDEGSITAWAGKVAGDFNIHSNIALEPVHENLYMNKYRYGNHDIFFLSSQDDYNSMDLTVTIKDPKKTAWCWDPETGKRHVYPSGKKGELQVSLNPLESLLLVLEDHSEGEIKPLVHPEEAPGISIGEEWQVDLYPHMREPFTITMDKLSDFSSFLDERITTFAGEVHYKTSFELSDGDWNFLDLGTERHVTEASLNGRKLGVRWWGRHLYPIEEGILKTGENELEITYTTTLANYVNSLEDNPVAKRWVRLKEPEPMGLERDVRLLK